MWPLESVVHYILTIFCVNPVNIAWDQNHFWPSEQKIIIPYIFTLLVFFYLL